MEELWNRLNSPGYCSTGAAEDGRAPTEEPSCVKCWDFCSTGNLFAYPRRSHCWKRIFQRTHLQLFPKLINGNVHLCAELDLNRLVRQQIEIVVREEAISSR